MAQQHEVVHVIYCQSLRGNLPIFYSIFILVF